MIGVLQRRHARRGLGLPIHNEELPASLRRPIPNLGLNAKIKRAARLRERLDGIWHESRAEAGERDIMKRDAREVRSADACNLRPEALRCDRVAYETQPAASRQMRRDDGKPVGIMEGQMGDADAPSVDRQPLSDLTRVGDDSVTRQPHIFLAAGRSGRGQKHLHGWVDGRESGIALPGNPFDGARAKWRRAYG